jgi:hypothetical protein
LRGASFSRNGQQSGNSTLVIRRKLPNSWLKFNSAGHFGES